MLFLLHSDIDRKSLILISTIMIHVIIFVSDSKLKQNNLCFRFHLNVKLKLPVTFDFESLHYLNKKKNKYRAFL